MTDVNRRLGGKSFQLVVTLIKITTIFEILRDALSQFEVYIMQALSTLKRHLTVLVSTYCIMLLLILFCFYLIHNVIVD